MPTHNGNRGHPFPWRTDCCTTGYSTRVKAEEHEASCNKKGEQA